VGLPITEFKDIGAVYFLRDFTNQSLREYCERLEGAVKSQYASDASSVAMVEQLGPMLSERPMDRLGASYRFRAGDELRARAWKLRITATEIPHLAVGTTDDESDINGVPLEFAKLIVERGAADVVDYAPLERRRKRFGLPFTGGFHRPVTVLGTVAGVYVSLKVECIPHLRNKMRWQASSVGGTPFMSLWAGVNGLLGGNNPGLVSIHYEPEELVAFLREYDEAVHAGAARRNLDDLFASVGVGLDEWLAAQPRT
jgi:hypothetical protein